jgi:methyl-accepting chemotaxis protein
MRLFAPVERLTSGRNKVKQLACGVVFSVPLAIAVWAAPPGWGPAGWAVAASYLVALYYLCGMLASTDGAWKDIHRLASSLEENDLRAAAADERGIAESNRAGRGQMGRLYLLLRRIHGNLAQVVGQASRSAAATRAAAEALARGNVELSQRAEDQASTLEETAAALEQLSSTVKSNADSCREASELAARATTVARDGAQVAGQASATMERIDQSARRIVDIISVIEGIAFQTNILALNAAVEAARAGEQGRGFAVVASEVRSLAQRSAQAAREIRGLIGESVGNVGEGTRLVQETSRIIDDVSGAVEQVNELIGIVAVASREQADGVESVNLALSQLQQATQRTAAVVQEAAFAAVTLKEEAALLAERVGVFHTDEAPRAPAAARVPDARRARALAIAG